MDELLTQINELYGLSLHSFEKVTKGFLSENHILFQDDKRYFLKKYRFENKERIEEIHSAKKYFADGGIPVILPVINKKQETFFLNDGYYALFPFIEDKQLERGSLTDTATVSLGEMLGKIHLLGKESTLPIKERFKPWDKEKSLDKIEAIGLEIKKKTMLNDFDKLALDNIQLKKNLILKNSIVYEDLDLPSDHLIHGDYLDQNVFFGDDDNVSHVFDFEKTDYSPRMYELFRSMMYGFLSDEIVKEDLEKSKLYLNSYLSIYPTSKEELIKGLKLFYFKSIHAVWVESEHYLKDNDRSDVYLLSDFKRVKYLSEHYEEFEEGLIKN